MSLETEMAIENEVGTSNSASNDLRNDDHLGCHNGQWRQLFWKCWDRR